MTTLAHETLVEHQIMEHIKDALRLTLDARAWPAAQGRKLASVRFMATRLSVISSGCSIWKKREATCSPRAIENRI